jgi:hypothetical protein
MIKNILIVFSALVIATYSVKAQEINLKLKNKKYPYNKNNLGSLTKKTDSSPILFGVYVLTLINPMLVIEDKTAFFGLTKEISLGLQSAVRAGRISFEYTYVFRNYNRNHLRFSYNYDLILESSPYVSIILTPGAGYFTDTKNKGWFLHASGGIFFVPLENVALYPYLRCRHTFIPDKNKSDINDISLGMAFLIYL